MSGKKEFKAAPRLAKLGAELKQAYAKAGEFVAETLAPVDDAIAEIGEAWAPAHVAEAMQSADPANVHPSPGCFLHETFTNGDEAEYVMCVARNQDRRCGLHVSVCKYRIPHSNNGGRLKPIIKEKTLVPPAKLPVPLRLKMLDALDAFADGYEQHVRQVRSNVLCEWGHAPQVAGRVRSSPVLSDISGAVAGAAAEEQKIDRGAETEAGGDELVKRDALARDPLDDPAFSPAAAKGSARKASAGKAGKKVPVEAVPDATVSLESWV